MKIGISGLAGAGKDTVADIIATYGYKKVSMADRLKDMVSLLYGLDREMLSGSTPESRYQREQVHPQLTALLAGKGIFKDDTVITPRLLLQRVGTDVCRNLLGPNVWVSALDTVDDYNIVISDARFLNELRSCDITIQVVRDTVATNSMHSSETEHLSWDFDYVIGNTGTRKELEEKVWEIIMQIEG